MSVGHSVLVTCERDRWPRVRDSHDGGFNLCDGPASPAMAATTHPLLFQGLWPFLMIMREMLPLVRQLARELLCEAGVMRCHFPGCPNFRTLQKNIAFERELRRPWR